MGNTEVIKSTTARGRGKPYIAKPPFWRVDSPGDRETGRLPILTAVGTTLPEAWMMAMFALDGTGLSIPTSFDKESDPESLDGSVRITVQNPLQEPRLHKLAWPGFIQELEHYVREVVDGVHDHWIGQEIDTKLWEYSYHERLVLFKWRELVYNQYEGLVAQLIEEGKRGRLYRRRFQITTWIPEKDQRIGDPPCLQRIWLRFVPVQDGAWVMNVETDWRSRDGFKASFMNMYAIIEMCRILAARLSEEIGVEIRFGLYVDSSNSLHVYGADIMDEEAGNFHAVMARCDEQDLSELVWNASDFHDDFIAARHLLHAQLISERVHGIGKGVVCDWLEKAVPTLPYPPEWDN